MKLSKYIIPSISLQLFLSLSHFMEFILFLKSFPKLFSVCATYCLELGIQIIVPPRGFLHFLGQFGVMTAECYKFTLQNKHLLRLLCSTHLTLEQGGQISSFKRGLFEKVTLLYSPDPGNKGVRDLLLKGCYLKR